MDGIAGQELGLMERNSAALVRQRTVRKRPQLIPCHWIQLVSSWPLSQEETPTLKSVTKLQTVQRALSSCNSFCFLKLASAVSDLGTQRLCRPPQL